MVKRPAPSTADAMAQELRRGAIVLAVLGQLRHERYGYALRERLAQGGLAVNEGTLYPLLRRLEAQGLLASRWQLGEGRPRRYYRLSEPGERALAALRQEWRALSVALDRLVERT